MREAAAHQAGRPGLPCTTDARSRLRIAGLKACATSAALEACVAVNVTANNRCSTRQLRDLCALRGFFLLMIAAVTAQEPSFSAPAPRSLRPPRFLLAHDRSVTGEDLCSRLRRGLCALRGSFLLMIAA